MNAGISAGDKFGPYEILARVGAGGMGEVWRARDTRLNREVAIKFSQAEFSDRFQREANAIAALNHPNICTLFDVGPNYLVMELIEGPTLADRIQEGPIALEEALKIAGQIADALDAAHEKGIVHRDLKPGNIKTRPDGSVKVLDFGLAKSGATDAQLSHDSPTLMHSPTMVGVILGTAAYMAPEQARGKTVDKRADIWAFGVVLYEMLTGKRLFEGEDLTETLASVVKSEPNLTPVPEKVRPLLEKCLQKDPKKRLRDIGDWTLLLEEEGPTATAPNEPSRSVWKPIAIGALVAVVAVTSIFYMRSEPAPLPANLLMDVAPAEMLGPATFYGRPAQTAFAISPDGETIVFAGLRDGKSMLYRRPLTDAAAVAISGTEGGAAPFFSPDGQWVGFVTEKKLKKVALKGGPSIDLCDIASGRGFWGGSWGSTGTIVYAEDSLWTIPDSGAKPTELLKPGPETEALTAPTFLPDGKTVLFTSTASIARWEDARIESIDLATKQRRTILTNAADARYLPTGHLIFMRSSSLLAVGFNARRMEVSGSPVPLIAGIMQSINAPNAGDETGMGQFALSGFGTLVYASGGIYPTPSSSLVQVDRGGKETKLAETQGSLIAARISPDGHRLVAFKTSEGSRASDLWMFELPSGVTTRLTSTGMAAWPLFSADGKSVLYADGSGKDAGIYQMPVNGGAATRLKQATGDNTPLSRSGDGKWLAWESRDRRVLAGELTGGESRQIGPAKFTGRDAEFSPDGHWIAYATDESGTNEIYVEAFPGPGEKHRVTSSGGVNPAWSRDGKELFFMQRKGPFSAALFAVPMSNGAPAGAPHPMIEGSFVTTTPTRSYDVTPDGRFIMVRRGALRDENVTQLHVLPGWSEELKRRVK